VKVGKIVYSTPHGHITIEESGTGRFKPKSLSYVVWRNEGTAAKRFGTFGLNVTNSFDRAKAFLATLEAR
jgi:hypothetical protein